MGLSKRIGFEAAGSMGQAANRCTNKLMSGDPVVEMLGARCFGIRVKGFGGLRDWAGSQLATM